MPSRLKVLYSVAAVIIAIAVGTYALMMTPSVIKEISIGEALVGGPFSLTDQSGRRVTEKDFGGKFMLVYFGYTFCPDVCPTELQVMMAALDTIGAKAERITPVFITIDPARDTVETIKSYVENFGPRLVGLTGTADEIAAAAQAYRVYYEKAGDVSSPDYLMDHSSIIYLMDPNGKFIKHFTYTTDAAKLADDLSEAVANSP